MTLSRRARNFRRALSMDILEGRQLLSGNVTATLGPTGILLIQGDNGNHTYTISQPAGTTNDLRISGTQPVLPPPPALPNFTSINGVAYVDFTLSSITSIQIEETGPGNNTVYVQGTSNTAKLAIPNAINTEFGTGTDALIASNISTSQLMARNTNAAGSDTYNVTNLTSGNVGFRGGPSGDTVSVTSTAAGNTIGTLTVMTTPGTGNDNVTLSGYTNGTRTGIGNATISTGDGNDTINVTGNTMASLAVNAGNGNNKITVASPSITNAANITTGNGKNNIIFDNSTFGSSIVTAGTGANTINVSNDSITKAGGLSVTAGVAGMPNLQNVTINQDAIPLGPMSLTLGDGPVYYQALPMALLSGSSLVASSDTVGGAVNVKVGTNFRTVTLGADTSHSLTAKSLLVNVGPNEDNVAVNAVVSGDESIQAGNFETYPTPIVPAPTFLMGGSAATLSNLSVGDNAHIATQNSAITGTESATFGNGEGTVTVTRPTAGSSTIKVGNNVGTLNISGNDTGGIPLWNENITVGTGSGTTTITGAVSGSETFGVSDNATMVNQGTAVGTDETVNGTTNENVSITGNVGGKQTINFTSDANTLNASGNVGGAQTITAPGNNNTIGATGTVGGAQTISSPGTGSTITDSSPTVTSATITAGDNATATVDGVTATGNIGLTVGNNANLIELINSTGQELNVTGGTAGASTFYYLASDTTLGGGADPNALNLDTGTGSNTIELVGLTVTGGMNVSAGAGANDVYAMDVVTDFGSIDGGSMTLATYYDFGGNVGYATMNFVGYVTVPIG